MLTFKALLQVPLRHRRSCRALSGLPLRTGHTRSAPKPQPHFVQRSSIFHAQVVLLLIYCRTQEKIAARLQLRPRVNEHRWKSASYHSAILFCSLARLGPEAARAPCTSLTSAARTKRTFSASGSNQWTRLKELLHITSTRMARAPLRREIGGGIPPWRRGGSRPERSRILLGGSVWERLSTSKPLLLSCKFESSV
ncbi:hypothetical protein MPH_05944 [Macrophomina phaseolina MS6]|uniref:Uncharacterized protein n=1 Tax=Macrophomina phaseolina (strain MS6) TaxID=1126212 RepID=K2R3E2_MACPH|nr:hypothetical protein MPH_05944 [Macrophomina phaseolina MS6]